VDLKIGKSARDVVGGAISPESQVKSQYETAALRHFDLPDDRCGVIFDRFSRTCLPVDVRLAPKATLAVDGDEACDSNSQNWGASNHAP
jgi:hypothetical protein